MSRTARIVAVITVILATVSLGACAGGSAPSTSSAPSAPIQLKDAWARPGMAGAGSAAYVTVVNPGSSGDAIVSVSTPGAARAELHETKTDSSGMTGMMPVSEIAVPAGETIALTPGGMHVMLMDLTADLATGDTLELTFTFRQAGPLTVRATIKPG